MNVEVNTHDTECVSAFVGLNRFAQKNYIFWQFQLFNMIFSDSAQQVNLGQWL